MDEVEHGPRHDFSTFRRFTQIDKLHTVIDNWLHAFANRLMGNLQTRLQSLRTAIIQELSILPIVQSTASSTPTLATVLFLDKMEKQTRQRLVRTRSQSPRVKE
jgi:hypothetical protein